MKKLATSSSFYLVLLVSCRAGVYGDLSKDLSRAKTPDQAVKAIKSAHLPSTIETALLANAKSGWYGTRGEALKRAVQDLARAESASVPKTASKSAARIKKSPLYVDNGIKHESNWLARSLDELLRRLSQLFKPDKPPDLTGSPSNSLFSGATLTYIVWTVISTAALVLAYFVYRQFSWKKTLKQRALALLGDEEPSRTLDEWLQLADQLENEGKFREVVRCLYLACLMRLDEYKVARFERSETNWEHLARIEGSSRLPEGIDMRVATQEFDRIWYGYDIRGENDVRLFRSIYRTLTEQLAKEGLA